MQFVRSFAACDFTVEQLRVKFAACEFLAAVEQFQCQV